MNEIKDEKLHDSSPVEDERKADQNVHELFAQTRERLQAVLDNTPIVLWSIDINGIFSLSEGKGLEQLSLKPGQIVGMNIKDVYIDNSEILSNIEEALQGRSVTFVTEENGTIYESFVSPIFDENGKVVGASGVSVDVTEQTMLRDQVRHAQKMEALGNVVGGLVHDFNNQITGITAGMDLLRLILSRNDQLNPEIESYFDVIENSTCSLAGMTQQLLAFSRKQKLDLHPINLDTVMSEFMQFARHILVEQIELNIKFVRGLNPILADSNQIKQVLMNLVINASHAINGPGSINISAENVTIDDETENLIPNFKVGDYVCIKVKDSGSGMGEELKDKIFDPFFTTKKSGEGTGLGLAVVHGIVKQHGGWIRVITEEGVGSTFEIYLPVSKKKSKNEASRKRLLDIFDGKGRKVLLIEDESAVGHAIYRYLTGCNMEVASVQNLTEAAELLLREEEFDLIISDIMLPEGSGVDFIKQAKITQPVIFMSGYSQESEDLDEFELIEKPFSLSALALRVKELLKL